MYESWTGINRHTGEFSRVALLNASYLPKEYSIHDTQKEAKRELLSAFRRLTQLGNDTPDPNVIVTSNLYDAISVRNPRKNGYDFPPTDIQFKIWDKGTHSDEWIREISVALLSQQLKENEGLNEFLSAVCH